VVMMFDCSCGMTFEFYTDFRLHKVLAHGEGAQFSCGLCGGAFLNEFSLAAHQLYYCSHRWAATPP
jgi:hypothetical protein